MLLALLAEGKPLATVLAFILGLLALALTVKPPPGRWASFIAGPCYLGAGILVLYLLPLSVAVVALVLLAILGASLFAYRKGQEAASSSLDPESSGSGLQQRATDVVGDSPTPASNLPMVERSEHRRTTRNGTEIAWEETRRGQDAGVTPKTVQAETHVPTPPLHGENAGIGVCIDEEHWDSWEFRARILEMRIRLENRTNRAKKLTGFELQQAGGGGVTPDATREMGRVEVLREIERRKQARQARDRLDHVSALSPRESVSGWLVYAFPWSPETGAPGYTLSIRDELNIQYEAHPCA